MKYLWLIILFLLGCGNIEHRGRIDVRHHVDLGEVRLTIDEVCLQTPNPQECRMKLWAAFIHLLFGN